MPIVVVLLGGIFWKRATSQAAFLTMVIGLPVGLVGFATGELFELHEVQFLYATGVMVLFSAVLFVAISADDAGSRPPPTSTTSCSTGPRGGTRPRASRGTPVWQNYRWLSLAILIITIAVVVPFI